jgi:hypothetical protein
VLADPDVIPIAVIDVRVLTRVFAATTLVDHTFRGADVVFTLDRERWVSSDPPPAWIGIDCGDGLGLRPARIGDRIPVHYMTRGTKTLRLLAGASPSSFREARFTFRVDALGIDRPDDTLRVVASLPYQSGSGSGDAFVYLGNGHSRIERPVVIVEGFDLENNQHADELYALLDRQKLATQVRALGYDLIVFDLTDATDYLQRNAFAIVTLLQQVQALAPPDSTIGLFGASTGAVMARYALAWMERHNVPHRVRSFVSLDGPYLGANVPLGLQHWFVFMGDIADAANFFVDRLDRPAARQILLQHFRRFPALGADPLRQTLLDEMSDLGWPQIPRLAGVANGSGAGVTQGFGPSALLLHYDYRAFLRRVRGDVWALPDQVPGRIFEGLFSIVAPLRQRSVVVNGTEPLDGMPGGFRATMLQMDTTAVPYGDIIAVNPNHCFVPTVSALAVDLPLGQDLRSVPNLEALSPFDAVYYPLENQEHVAVTEQNAMWMAQEILRPASAGGEPAASARTETRAGPRVAIETVTPNPFTDDSEVRFRLAEPGHARLSLFDAAGRRIATLVDQVLTAGDHRVAWARAVPLRPGLYLLALESDGRRDTRRIVRIETQRP